MDTVIISEAQSRKLLDIILRDNISYEPDGKKNQLLFCQNYARVLSFRLPISIVSPEAYYSHPEDRPNYVLIIIRSGIAVSGYFEDGEVMDHKVFRAYMVRKKQGMSQIKYLKTKGKSRAGSRVRLAESLEFFEEINQRLALYFKEQYIERIGLSCPVTLIPYLFGSKTATPFEKGDNRIFKIPQHVQHPTYKSLMATNDFLLKGELKYTKEGEDLLNYFLKNIEIKQPPLPDPDDW